MCYNVVVPQHGDPDVEPYSIKELETPRPLLVRGVSRCCYRFLMAIRWLLADTEDFGCADRAYPLSGGSTVLHDHFRGVFDGALALTAHTKTFTGYHKLSSFVGCPGRGGVAYFDLPYHDGWQDVK